MLIEVQDSPRGGEATNVADIKSPSTDQDVHINFRNNSCSPISQLEVESWKREDAKGVSGGC